MVNSDIVTSAGEIFDHLGRSIIHDYTRTTKVGKRDTLLPLPPRAVTDDVPPVGILGAGVGGLYSALILQSLNVSYEIIESTNRTGGRLFTHKFADGGFYDYFVSFNCIFFVYVEPNVFYCCRT